MEHTALDIWTNNPQNVLDTRTNSHQFEQNVQDIKTNSHHLGFSLCC